MSLPPPVLRCNDFRSFGLWLSKPAGKRTASVIRQDWLIWMEYIALVQRTRDRCRIAATCRTLVSLHRILAWPEADSQSDSEGSYEGLSHLSASDHAIKPASGENSAGLQMCSAWCACILKRFFRSFSQFSCLSSVADLVNLVFTALFCRWFLSV